MNFFGVKLLTKFSIVQSKTLRSGQIPQNFRALTVEENHRTEVSNVTWEENIR